MVVVKIVRVLMMWLVLRVRMNLWEAKEVGMEDWPGRLLYL